MSPEERDEWCRQVTGAVEVMADLLNRMGAMDDHEGERQRYFCCWCGAESPLVDGVQHVYACALAEALSNYQKLGLPEVER